MVNSMAKIWYLSNVDGGSKEWEVTQESFTMGNFMALKQPEIIDGNHENLEV